MEHSPRCVNHLQQITTDPIEHRWMVTQDVHPNLQQYNTQQLQLQDLHHLDHEQSEQIPQ